MRDDRLPRVPVAIHGDAEEMDVQLSPFEMRSMFDAETLASVFGSQCHVQAWLRVTDGPDREASIGFEVTPENEDGA
jgi:hypothetical protein